MSKDFPIDNMNKTGLKGYINAFYVNYNIIDTNDVWHIHKYLMKITINNIMLGFVLKNVY